MDFEGGFLRISHELDSMSLVSITAYDEMSVEYNETLSGVSTGQGFMPGQSGHSEVFSQEIRLTSTAEGAFRWIAGGYYSHDESTLATIIYRTDNGGAPFGIVPSIAIDQEVDIWSGYGQLELDMAERLTFTPGLALYRRPQERQMSIGWMSVILLLTVHQSPILTVASSGTPGQLTNLAVNSNTALPSGLKTSPGTKTAGP